MENSERLQSVINYAMTYAISSRAEYLTPEHIVLGLIAQSPEFKRLAESYNVNLDIDIKNKIYANMDLIVKVPEEIEDYEPEMSLQMQDVFQTCFAEVEGAGKEEVDVPHIINAIFRLEESMARYYILNAFDTDEGSLMADIVVIYDGGSIPMRRTPAEESFSMPFDDDLPFGSFGQKKSDWRRLVTCVNDIYAEHNPLVGRNAELERTIQVLCRRDKNNPLHIGEPGVGKTALVYGLAQRIEEGNVPERLKGSRIYQMDMGNLVAGTQYRGEFEERIKNIMEGVSEENGAIVYIDEIHTLIGSGACSDSSLDGSNMLKPYLEAGKIRFIGSTTYKEYNRYFQKSQGMVRRFQQIDIAEPTPSECVDILRGLKERYEQFHHVTYPDDVLTYAVDMSVKYMHDRFLPDKAIDLIDEAGAYREMHPIMRRVKGELQPQKKQSINRTLINDTIMRICKINEQTLQTTADGTERLATLGDRIRKQIYGQDDAINSVTEAVLMGKAGLLEAGKPIASLLFVGPTGVGKTEVCKVLAKEMGLKLIRFDMSEYTEKHAVAKLIGSPAGYVGYEDGGLLTDAVRKTPNCVLLLDEIEKAHADIYNILLQVMDYAQLTDNKGQKANFSNVILIMTSNAGAQHAAQASVGFASTTTAGTAMLKAVRQTFKPEFLGRLSATVVFNDLDRHMAELILDKKLKQLNTRLLQRNVTISVSDACRELLLDKGFSPRKGGREIDNVINRMITPLLTRSILFGSLAKGGNAMVDVVDGEVSLREV